MKEKNLVKILLVDDLTENLFALELILADKNYFFVRANSGNEALKILLREQDFAIILIDVQMPEMDGFETVDLIREIETLKHVPIIFLTASMDRSMYIFKGYQAGAVDYMIKPLIPEILKAKVAVFVELYLKTHELLVQNEEKEKRAAELGIANKELAFQNDEKEKRAAELIIANKELVFQNGEKGKRADELIVAYTELAFQNSEKIKRAEELSVANTELAFQNREKEKRADELIIANKELIYQNEEKGKRADELIIANTELAFQNGEKIKRADELIIANTELAFQNREKEKRADELIIANKELVYQNEEKEKRADELVFEKACVEEINIKLTNSNREIEQFAYIASHDLQEPLRTISNYVGLFLKKYKSKLDKDADKYLDFISGATVRMQCMIKDLLDYSQIGIDSHPSVIDCNLLLKEVLNDMSIGITENNATINSKSLPLISGHSTGIKSLFQNLISNAIKYRKKDTHPIISISAKAKSNEWLFTFKDNGIGIDKLYYEKLFIIFQRLHIKQEYAGTGIGLAQCKKVVELHGGKIWVESEPGFGSKFYFTILKP